MPLTDAKLRTLKPKDKPYKVGDFTAASAKFSGDPEARYHARDRMAEKPRPSSGRRNSSQGCAFANKHTSKGCAIS